MSVLSARGRTPADRARIQIHWVYQLLTAPTSSPLLTRKCFVVAVRELGGFSVVVTSVTTGKSCTWSCKSHRPPVRSCYARLENHLSHSRNRSTTADDLHHGHQRRRQGRLSGLYGHMPGAPSAARAGGCRVSDQEHRCVKVLDATTLHSDPRPTRRLRHSDITQGDPGALTRVSVS